MRQPLLSTANPTHAAVLSMGSAATTTSLLELEDAPVDEGFEVSGAPAFDRGRVTVRRGASSLDLTALQQPLSPGGWLRSVLAVSLAACVPVFGWTYLAKKLTVVRPGEIALVRSIAGETRALGPGWHLLSTVGTEIKKTAVTAPVVTSGTLSILRVMPGEIGCAQMNGQPLLLSAGTHLVNDALFTFDGTRAATAAHIQVASTLHVITVGRQQVGLCLANAQGHFLGAGRHAICHERFSFLGLRSLREEYLSVGSKHRIFLAEGRLGLAWDGGRPVVLEPAADRRPLCIDSPTFSFERSVPATQLVILHGSLKVVTVRQGFVGVSFADGVLEVLPPGRVTLSSVTHAFAGFLPTGQQTLQVASVDGMTSDNVGLQFDAAVCCQIVDARKAVMALSTTAASAREAGAPGGEPAFSSDTIWAAVQSKARLSLSIVVGNQRLNRGTARDEEGTVHQPGRGVGLPSLGLGPAPAEPAAAAEAAARAAARSAAAFDGDKGGGASATAPPAERDAGDPSVPGPAAAATSFRTRIHDSFMTTFAQRMLDECGIAVIEMSLEDVRITDGRLAEAMARGAVARADLSKADIERQIKVMSSEADKQADVVRAEGRAAATQITAAAEAARVRMLDDAFALLKSPLSQQREALIAAGEVMRGSASTLILAASPADAAAMLSGGGGGGGGGLAQQMQQQRAAASRAVTNA